MSYFSNATSPVWSRAVNVSSTAPSPSVNFSDNEIPLGALDGINTNFVLAFVPVPGSLCLHKNGLMNIAEVDYTINGRVISYKSAPEIGATLAAWYRY